jgi:hypothetical protein
MGRRNLRNATPPFVGVSSSDTATRSIVGFLKLRGLEGLARVVGATSCPYRGILALTWRTLDGLACIVVESKTQPGEKKIWSVSTWGNHTLHVPRESGHGRPVPWCYLWDGVTIAKFSASASDGLLYLGSSGSDSVRVWVGQFLNTSSRTLTPM